MTKSVWVGGIGGLLLGVVGFFAGRASVGDPGPVDENGVRADRLEQRAVVVPGTRERAGDDWRSKYGGDPRVATRRVMRQLSQSPMMHMDFDSMLLAWELFRGMSLEEIEQAIEEVEEAKNPQIAMMMKMMMMGRWGALDGQGAVEYALAQDGMQRMMTVNGALMGWMKHDPEGAHAWYEENRDQISGGMMGRGQLDALFYSHMAQNDLKGALEKVSGLGARDKMHAISSIAGHMAMDPARREEFFETLAKMDDAGLAKNARQSMIASWAWQDPKGAAAYLESLDLDESEKKQLEQSLVSSWSNLNAEEALEWKLSKADSLKDRQEALQNSFGNWLRQDEKAAGEWLAQQPEELMTDALFESASESLRWNNEYARSAAWAEQIVDEGKRSNKLKELYRNWKSHDETKANEWLGTLDEETQAALVAGEGEHPASTETVGSANVVSGSALDSEVAPELMREAVAAQLEALGEPDGDPGSEIEVKRRTLEAILKELETHAPEGE